MTPLYVDGATPPRAASPTTGTTPRPQPVATRERAQQLAALFTAQVQQSMLDSLTAMSADEGAEEGGGEATDDGGGFGDLDATTGAAGLGSVSAATAGAGDEAALAQQLLAAYASLDGAALGAGSGVGAVAGGGTVSGATAPAGSTDARANAAVVADVAREQGVDPVAAVAMMLVESGGNAGAVGDGGTSFGLFQLHEGGMLTAAGLSAQQAFDPRTNATVSLRSLRHEWGKGHATRTPGEIAAASQRPADPAGYARKVDAMLDRARSLLA